jgi:prephenate dehydratase
VEIRAGQNDHENDAHESDAHENPGALMKIEDKARVAFQGERGAFSEEAAVKLLGENIMLVPRSTFEAAFRAIFEGLADYVLAPIENSLAGSVHRSFDLLVGSNLNIIGEEIIPIVHNLIGAPGARFDEVRVVESHPVALAQCEHFFSERPRLKRIATEDTAGSVREVVLAGDPTRAAIASRRAAEIYGGVILREHLEDNAENYTRFWLLSPSQIEPADADKLSLFFELDHRPGALLRALEPFARRGINLMKIESRPVHGKPWQYRFYLDLQAARSNPEAAAALVELEKEVVDLRILGSYAGAKTSAAAKG